MVVCLEDTPLHRCVEHNLLAAVSALLSHGSDVNCKNKQGLSPLHVAVQVKSGGGALVTSADEIVHCLVKNGYNTDINLPDAHGIILSSPLTLQTPKAIIVLHRIIQSWYTGR